MTVPGFTSTLSKRPEDLFGTVHDVPVRMTRAAGCTVWDDRGREYVDLVMGLGAVALGYGHPAVVEAAERGLRDGIVGPLAPVLEARVAEKLCAVLPGAEAARFLKTGAEAVAAAVRIARAYSGRDRVLSCGYHGWLDWCQDGRGVPESVRSLRSPIPFNDVDALLQSVGDGDDVAAIVVEPIVDEPPTATWLEALRREATRVGALLVFDEIKTAFRVATGGVAERWGVTPDLTVVGKALGNGLPIAAVAGGHDVMRVVNDTWISSTLATEMVSLAAADAVLDTFRSQDVPQHLSRVGTLLFNDFGRLAEQHPQIVRRVRGVPEMCYLEFRTPAASAQTAQAAARRSLLLKRSAYNFVSLAHTDAVLTAVRERLEAALEEVSAC
ncbi:MAG: aminotransferase class III-fold pyridoxal phosphate-dependent enzyme [Gemmatimonadota bacterium]|nr:aminotransferase class III-fold pyridoxal phosphate-dependent enzyme [Gemmatimonadota bacterium]